MRGCWFRLVYIWCITFSQFNKLHRVSLPYFQHLHPRCSLQRPHCGKTCRWASNYIRISLPCCPASSLQPLHEGVLGACAVFLDKPWSTRATFSLATSSAHMPFFFLAHFPLFSPTHHSLHPSFPSLLRLFFF